MNGRSDGTGVIRVAEHFILSFLANVCHVCYFLLLFIFLFAKSWLIFFYLFFSDSRISFWARRFKNAGALSFVVLNILWHRTFQNTNRPCGLRVFLYTSQRWVAVSLEYLLNPLAGVSCFFFSVTWISMPLHSLWGTSCRDVAIVLSWVRRGVIFFEFLFTFPRALQGLVWLCWFCLCIFWWACAIPVRHCKLFMRNCLAL